MRQFIDVFGGSAAVLLNVLSYPVEPANDLDADGVNFFMVLLRPVGKECTRTKPTSPEVTLAAQANQTRNCAGSWPTCVRRWRTTLAFWTAPSKAST